MRIASAFIVMLWLSTYGVLAQSTYSKSDDISALRLSFGQLQNVLNTAASLVRSANGPTSKLTEELELKSGSLKVAVTGHVLHAEGVKIPQSLDGMQYTARAQEPSPITRV